MPMGFKHTRQRSPSPGVPRHAVEGELKSAIRSPGRGAWASDGPADYAPLPTDDSDNPLETDDEEPVRKPTEAENEMRECREQRPYLAWVEAVWFQSMSAVIIVANIMMTVGEVNNPPLAPMFWWPEQVMLVFYIFELIVRYMYFGYYFFRGQSVVWNILDITVVVSGILDQWILGILFPVSHDSPLKSLLKVLRLLRLFRVLKLVRVFMEADLTWTERPAFQSFIGMVIAFNALLMGFETDVEWSGWQIIEQVLLCIYVFEISCRLKHQGRTFFYNEDMGWNLMDFAIVTSSMLDGWLIPVIKVVQKEITGSSQGINLGPIMMVMRMLRLMRILRLVRLVKTVRPLYNLVMGVVVAMQGVAWVLVLTVVSIYAMGILATRLVGHGMIFGAESQEDVSEELANLQKPFKTVPDSMFILFKVMNGAQSDDDAKAIDTLMTELPAMKFAFVFFMIASSWTLLSILTAVVSENMISTTSAQEEEFKLESAEADRAHHIKELKQLFSQLDLDGNGTATKEELNEFLSDPDRAMECARSCRVPSRYVMEVMEVLSETANHKQCNDTNEDVGVSLETFIDCLTEVGNTATEKSIMKLEAKLNNLEDMTRLTVEEVLEAQHEQAKMLRQVLGMPDPGPRGPSRVSLRAASKLGRAPSHDDRAPPARGGADLAQAVQALSQQADSCYALSQQVTSPIHALAQQVSAIGSKIEVLQLRLGGSQPLLGGAAPAAAQGAAAYGAAASGPSAADKLDALMGSVQADMAIGLMRSVNSAQGWHPPPSLLSPHRSPGTSMVLDPGTAVSRGDGPGGNGLACIHPGGQHHDRAGFNPPPSRHKREVSPLRGVSFSLPASPTIPGHGNVYTLGSPGPKAPLPQHGIASYPKEARFASF